MPTFPSILPREAGEVARRVVLRRDGGGVRPPPPGRVTPRLIRNAGFIACLVGALVMVTARFTAYLPDAAIWLGLAVILLGWGLFVLSIVRRARHHG